MQRLKEVVTAAELKHVSDMLHSTIRKELHGKHSSTPTKSITGSELDKETDYLWDLVYSVFAQWTDNLDSEDGPEDAKHYRDRQVGLWKKYNAEDAKNLERWLDMAIKLYMSL